MTEFKIVEMRPEVLKRKKLEGKLFSVAYKSGKRFLTLATIHTLLKEKKLSIVDVWDISRTGLYAAQMPERREFIKQFGTTPARMLTLLLIQRFGSEKTGLEIMPITRISEAEKASGTAFMESLIKQGLLQKHGEGLFIPPAIVKKVNALGQIRMGEAPSIPKERILEFFPPPGRKPSRLLRPSHKRRRPSPRIVPAKVRSRKL